MTLSRQTLLLLALCLLPSTCARADIVIGPFVFHDDAFADTAAVIGTEDVQVAFGATTLEEALTGFSPGGVLANIGGGANANEYKVGFNDLTAANGPGPDIVLFEAIAPLPFDFKVQVLAPDGQVWETNYSRFDSPSDYVRTSVPGLRADEFAFTIDLDRFGLGPSERVNALFFRGVGGGNDVDMVAVLNTTACEGKIGVVTFAEIEPFDGLENQGFETITDRHDAEGTNPTPGQFVEEHSIASAGDRPFAESRARSGGRTGMGSLSRVEAPLNVDTLLWKSAEAHATSTESLCYVAQYQGAGSPPSEVGINVSVIYAGVLEVLNTGVNNPFAPSGPDDVRARVEVQVNLVRGGQKTSVFAADATLSVVAAERDFSSTTNWESDFTPASLVPTNRVEEVLNYNESLLDLFTVPIGAEFTIEYVLRTEAFAGASAGGWRAKADFFKPDRAGIWTGTPGVEIVSASAAVENPGPGSCAPFCAQATGSDQLKVGRLLKDTVDAQNVAVEIFDDGTFSFEYAGRAYAGTAIPKGRSGRKFLLSFGDWDLSRFYDVLAARAEESAGVPIEFEPSRPPKIIVAIDKARTTAKLKAKFSFLATSGDVTQRGSYVIKKALGDVTQR